MLIRKVSLGGARSIGEGEVVPTDLTLLYVWKLAEMKSTTMRTSAITQSIYFTGE